MVRASGAGPDIHHKRHAPVVGGYLGDRLKAGGCIQSSV